MRNSLSFRTGLKAFTLAEGATHVDTCPNDRENVTTLVECATHVVTCPNGSDETTKLMESVTHVATCPNGSEEITKSVESITHIDTCHNSTTQLRHSEAGKLGDPSLTLRMTGAEESHKIDKEVVKSLRRWDVKFLSESSVGGNADGLSSLPTLPSLIREGGAPILMTDFGDLYHDSKTDKNLTTYRPNVLSSSIKSPRHSEVGAPTDPSLTLRTTGAEESHNNFQFSIFNFQFKKILNSPFSILNFKIHSQFKNAAFTLSEVLITLGVIGVVAAITMPVLIKNYQKMVWVNQLKKNYSILQQGFQKMLVDEGVDRLTDISAFHVLSSDIICNTPTSNDDWRGEDEACKDITDYFRKYFKGDYKKLGRDFYYLESADYNGYDQMSEEGALTLLDGTQLNFDFYIFSPQRTNLGRAYIGNVRIDLNGPKGPNTYGRDIFLLSIINNGKLTPGDEAERIIKNGWKMDY